MVSPELEKLLEAMRAQPVPESPPTLEERRQGMEAMMAANPLPDDIKTEPVDAGGVRAEWVSAPGADPASATLYVHGGGYVLGSINTHREFAGRLSRESGARVLNVDYRLAPEHPFPAAVDDATAAYRWMLKQGITPERAAIGGDSAGGGLTVATLVALRDAGDPLPAAAICLSPWVDLEGTGNSMTEKASVDPMVQQAGLLEMAAAYLGGADPKTPLAAPLHADLLGLPPMLIQVGTAETLLDDARRLADRAKQAGVDVTLEPWEDMVHVWQIFRVPEADQATSRLGEFLKQRLGAPVS